MTTDDEWSEVTCSPVGRGEDLPTAFDKFAEEILGRIGRDSRIRMSVRAPSFPALGFERSGAAFDYLSITQDAVCFLQPNPAPPLLVVLDYAGLSSLEWNGDYLFIKPAPHAEITIAEATTGWGSKIKSIDFETVPASQFFFMWTRWKLRHDDLRFAEAIASSARLRRRDAGVGVIFWETVIEATTSEPPVGEPASSGRMESGSSDRSNAHAQLRYAGVTDMIGQVWLVEVEGETIIRALKVDDFDIAGMIADGQFDGQGSRQLLDEWLETQEDVDSGLLELLVSEEGLPFDVMAPSDMR